MKKQLLHIATTLSLCLMLGLTAAAQMTRQMTITIPFDFHVGKTALPAGTYTVYGTGTHAGDGFLLRDDEGRAEIVFSAHQVQSRESQSVARLEFRRYDGKHFLARVWAAGSNIGRELQPSRLERETAQGAARHLVRKDVKPEVITVTTQ